MNSKSLLLPLVLAIGLWSAGCDTGAPQGDAVASPDTGNPVSPGTSEAPPVLIRVEGADKPVCPGDVVTLVGFNFSNVLEENQVRFSAGNRTVEGIPLTVQIDPSTAGDGGSKGSRLDVVVPGGVSRGNVELLVGGQSAGAAGIDVCPMLIGFTLGNAQGDPILLYTPLGFQDGASRVTLYGLNFTDVQEVLVDANGSASRRVPSGSFIRNPVNPSANQNQEPTGLDSLAFNLRDDINDVRLPISNLETRVDMGIELRGPNHNSNKLMIPVSADPTAEEVGAVISSVKVPVGVVSGAVPIHYTCYELRVNAEWQIRTEFRVSNESFTSPWSVAKPLEGDEENDGNFNILMGSPMHRNGNRLLPGIGARRTFVWDAPNDPLFRLYNEETDQTGQSRPRHWKVEFRFTPIPDTVNREFIEHIAVTPPFVYYDLMDRPSEDESADRTAVVFEDFVDDLMVDRQATTAVWGPPINPGLLTGSTDSDGTSDFGDGQAVMVFANVDPETFIPPGETLVDEFVQFDTSRVEVTHHVITLSDNGTPADPADDFEVTKVFAEPFQDLDANIVENPGHDEHEFHFASMTIRPGVHVVGVGEFPLVIRLSGGGETASADEVVFHIQSDEESGDGWIDINGGAGGAGSPLGSCPPPPNCGVAPGGGGAGGPGAGDGGRGGELTVINGQLNVQTLVEASDGENDGGLHGVSPAAVHFNQQQPRSVFNGSPGGGGGHNGFGGAGDYGNNSIAQYQIPRPGRGGPIRGTKSQVVLTGGSGGGGGGGSLSKVDGANLGPYFTAGGGGGGGGGGAMRVVARGTVVIDGRIEANGGGGGTGEIPHFHSLFIPDYPHGVNQIATGGAGGGGSGGSIVLQATGEISLLDCANLQVEGGQAGSSKKSGNQNRKAGAGDGAPGYVRLESAGRALPFCGEIPVEEGLLSAGGLTEALDPVEEGRGQDGVLHLRFIPSIDPLTGAPEVDPETGRPTSIWAYDTESGLLTNPRGDTLRTRSAGIIDLNRLIIDEDVSLRVSGTKRFVLKVREIAIIAGTIDVSGFAGGALQFSSPGTVPLAGLAGEPGPGGGRGGAGGTIEYVNGSAADRTPENTIPVDGEPGGVPAGMEMWETSDPLAVGDSSGDLLTPSFVRAGAGGSLRGRGTTPCDSQCVALIDGESAGGGAGGGHNGPGDPGEILILTNNANRALAGAAGTGIGFESLRFDGGLFLSGGLGGAGGGASANVSSAYVSGGVRGRFAFPSAALLAPGTGGGGGGGVLHLVAGSLELMGSARLTARGGDAYQSIDTGGNGGAGAGGVILIQVTRSINIANGAVIDVSGGVANRIPPLTSEGVEAYEGNVRSSFLNSSPEEGATPFGGLGGNGAPGRVRIEAPRGSALVSLGSNASVTTGTFLQNVVLSEGVSLPIRLGLGPAFSATSQRIRLGAPRLQFSPLQPPGTDVHVVWEGARESLDVHASVSELVGNVEDPRDLVDQEYLRFRAWFRSNFLSRSSQSIQSLTLPYELRIEPGD